MSARAPKRRGARARDPLALLAWFDGPFDHDLGRQLLMRCGLIDATEVLDALRRAGALEASRDASGRWLYVIPQAEARALREASDDALGAATAHAQVVVEAARALVPEVPFAQAPPAVVGTELLAHELAAAIDRALDGALADTAAAELAIEAAVALDAVAAHRSPTGAHAERLARLAAWAGPRASREAVASIIVRLARALRHAGAIPEAREAIARAESLAAGGGPRVLADAALVRAQIEFDAGDLGAARDHYRAAADRYEACGSGAGVAHAALGSADVHLELADPTAALPAIKRALARGTQDDGAAVRAYLDLALVRMELDQLDAARQALAHASVRNEVLGSRRADVLARYYHGMIRLLAGDADAAQTALELAERDATAIGHARYATFARAYRMIARGTARGPHEVARELAAIAAELHAAGDARYAALFDAYARFASGSAVGGEVEGASRPIAAAIAVLSTPDAPATCIEARVARAFVRASTPRWTIDTARGAVIRPDGASIAISSKLALALLVELARGAAQEAGRWLEPDEMIARVHAADRAGASSARDQLYEALGELRGAGLGSIVQRDGARARVDPGCRVEIG